MFGESDTTVQFVQMICDALADCDLSNRRLVVAKTTRVTKRLSSGEQ